MVLRKNYPLILIFFLAVIFIIFFQFNYKSITRAKDDFLLPPQIVHFTFGYGEVIADAMWLRTVQDFNYCKSKKLKADGTPSVDCEDFGWVYQMLDRITDISPRFRIVYATGTLTLSILVSDIQGASRLFDKAVRAFPKDWPILYRAGYHALYEEKNKTKAAGLLMEAARNGAPPWVYSLSGGLYGESGQLELAEKLLQEMKASKAEDFMIKKFEEKIARFKENP